MLFKWLLTIGTPEEEVLADPPQKIRQFLYYSPSTRHPTILSKIMEDESVSSDEESSDEEGDALDIRNNLADIDEANLLYRGVHFSPKYFDDDKRKLVRKREEHFKSVYSLATMDFGQKLGDLEQADQVIKSYFTMLKHTPDKPEFDTDVKRSPVRKKDGEKADYPNLYVHFVQAYVTTYGKLFNNGGMRRNFNFYADENPVLSTSRSVESASFLEVDTS